MNLNQDIKPLIEEGADVNFQYPDKDNNTRLHLAIKNKNVECVKLLLKHQPKLNIQNNNGETAENIAKTVSHDEITKVLADYRNHVYDSIDPKFIIDLNDNFSVQDIVGLKNDQNFRILRIQECRNIKFLFDKFKQKAFKEAFSKTSHLFAFIIEVNENNIDDFKFPVLIFNDKRPFIVIITQEAQLPVIYYNNSKSKRLIKLHCDQKSLRSSEPKFEISRYIRESVIDVLENRVKLQKGELTRMSSVLCIRLKKLFRSNLELQVPSTIDFDGSESRSYIKERLMAFYDLSFLNPEEKWSEILLAIIKSNHIEILKFILKNGFESECQGEHVNTAWNSKNFECVAELLEADSCFPQDFNLELVCQTIDRLRATISTRNSFHDAIKKGDKEMINDIIDKNPRWKFVYNQENKSALTVALESKQFDVYLELRSRGFLTGVDKNFDFVINILSNEEKRKVSEINKQCFTNLKNSHLMHLLSQVQLSSNQGNSSTLFSVVRSMFQKLDEIIEFQPVLKLLENCKKIKIVIDFDKPHILDMDLMATKGTDGLTNPISGYIYVAAKNYSEKFYDILGVLAHELMHYAMDLVYDNDCKPYELHDNKRKEQFTNILLGIKTHWDKNKETTDDIICRVFDSYPVEQWHAELIVRVPHLYGSFKEDEEALKNIEQEYCKDLFEFYTNSTLLDINAKCGLIKPQNEIQEINKTFGLLNKIDKYDYKLQKSFSFDPFLDREPTVIDSNVPMLSLACICQLLFKQFGRKMTKCVIFAKIESLENPHLLERIKNVCNSIVKPILVLKADKMSGLDKTLITLKSLNNKVVLICQNRLDEEYTISVSLNVTHEWDDLNKNSQRKLMQKKVIFQRHETILNEILKPVELKELNRFPLEDLLSGQLEVNKIEQKQNRIISRSFYVNRKFVVRKIQVDELRDLNSSDTKFLEIEMNEDEIIQEAQARKVLIISDVAGMGKSTSLFKIAETLQDKHKSHWVHFVDLKQHIRIFEQIEESENSITKLNEVLQKCIEKSIDQMIFLKLYEAGKTIILLDGVDEVSPDFNKFIMEALKSFDINSGNQLWIATRVHLQEGLEKQLSQLACKLLPISFEDQVEIVANYWKSKNENVQDLPDLKMLASKLIAKISKGLENSKSDLMEIPLQIRMIAEIYEGKTNENVQKIGETNLYLIYNKFYEKIFDNCLENKGHLPSVRLKEMYKSSGNTVLTVHQTIALYNFFGSDFDFQDDVEDLTQETRELIDKVGIAYFDSETEKYCFIHESFAEYFVSNYILANLKRKVQKQISQLLCFILTIEKFKTIRSFLDEGLKNKRMPSNLCFDTLEKYLEEEKLHDLLLLSVSEGLETLVLLIFSILDSFENNELKKEIVKCKTRINCTIPMSACNRNIRNNYEGKMLRIVCEYVEKLLTENELRLLMLEKDENMRNVLHWVIACCDQNDVQLLLRMVKKLFNGKERKDYFCGSDIHGWNIWHFAARNDNKEIFTTIQDRLKEFVDDVEVITMLRQLDVSGHNVFHSMISVINITALDDFKTFVQNVFKNKVELKLYLTEKSGKYGSNVFHMAAQMSKNYIFREIWKFLHFFCDPVVIKDLLLETNKSGSNIWHFAALNNEYEIIFTTIQDCIKKISNDIEIITMLRQQDISGHNVFHSIISVINITALDDFKTFVQNVFKNKEELKLFLTEKSGKYGSNVLQLAARFSKNDFFVEIWKLMQLFFDFVELKDLLLETNKNGSNIWHFAARNDNNKEVLTKIQDCLKDILTDIEITTMLRQKDIKGHNVFHLMISVSNVAALDDFETFVLNVFRNKNDLKLYLMEKTGKYGSNVLHMAAQKSKNYVFREVWKFMQFFFDSVELKCLLLETNSNGLNIGHFATCNHDGEILTYFFNHLISILSKTDLKKLVFQISNYKRNVLHYAIEWNSARNVKILWNICDGFLNKDEQKLWLGSCDDFKNKIFHIAARNTDHKGIFQAIINCTQNILTADEIKLLLRQKNVKGHNILHQLVVSNNERVMEECYDMMKTYFDGKDLRIFFIEKSILQSNLIQLTASCTRNIEFYKSFVNIILEVFHDSKAEIKKMFFDKNENDKNAFALASENNIIKVYLSMWKFICEKQLVKKKSPARLFKFRASKIRKISSPWGNIEVRVQKLKKSYHP